MKNERYYLTLEEKIEVLIDRIIDAGFDHFSSTHSSEEIEELEEIDFDTYDTEVFSQDLWVKGYENYILDDVRNMPFEDIVVIHNEIYRKKATLNMIEDMRVFCNKYHSPETEVIDEKGKMIIVPMWRAL